jgi:hypothetical protein
MDAIVSRRSRYGCRGPLDEPVCVRSGDGEGCMDHVVPRGQWGCWVWHERSVEDVTCSAGLEME